MPDTMRGRETRRMGAHSDDDLTGGFENFESCTLGLDS